MNKYILHVVSASLRFNRFDAAVERLPGAPNITAIKNCSAFSRLARANAMAKEAERLRTEAVATITSELQADWSDADIFKAFNEE